MEPLVDNLGDVTTRTSKQLGIAIAIGRHFYKCNKCSQRFCQLSQLQKHTHVHSGHRPFSCCLCKRRFRDAARLSVHMYSEIEGRLFTCLHCGATYSRLLHVRNHVVHQHSSEILDRAQTCYQLTHCAVSSSATPGTGSSTDDNDGEASDERESSMLNMSQTNKEMDCSNHKKTCTQGQNEIEDTLALNGVQMTISADDLASVNTASNLLTQTTSVKMSNASKHREELSQHAEALVNRLKHATCTLSKTQKHGAWNQSNSSRCKHAKTDAASEEQYCNGVQHAPESSPKDSGIDVSSPWPRELETTDSGSQSGTEQFSHTANSQSCFNGTLTNLEQNNNSEKHCSLKEFNQEKLLEESSEYCDETDSDNDYPPVLEKEPPILDMVQPAIFLNGLDEPSDLSEEETMDLLPGAFSSPSYIAFVDSLLTPDRKVKNDVCFAAARSPGQLPLSRQDSLILEDNSASSPTRNLNGGMLSSQQSSSSIDTQKAVGMDVGVNSLFPDLGDISPPSSQSSPVAAIRRPPLSKQLKPENFQSEFAKFLQKEKPASHNSLQTVQSWAPKKLVLENEETGMVGKRRLSSSDRDMLHKKLCTRWHQAAEWDDDVFPSMSDDERQHLEQKHSSSLSPSIASDSETKTKYSLLTSQQEKNLTHNEAPLTLSSPPHDQQQQQHKCKQCLKADCKHSVPSIRFNVKNYLTQQKKVVTLRRLVCRLFKVVFPALQYPRRFNHNTPVIEYLIDQVIDATTGRDTNKPKALCLDSEIHDVSIVLCASPRTCLRHLRRKIYHLLCALLPDLTVTVGFNTASDDVDRLLRLVLRCNNSVLQTPPVL